MIKQIRSLFIKRKQRSGDEDSRFPPDRGAHAAGRADQGNAGPDTPQNAPSAAAALQAGPYVATTRGISNDSIQRLRADVAANPTDFTLHYRLGCLLEDHGDLQAAVGSYEAALRLSPRFAPAYNNLGATSQKLRRMGDALRYFERARDLDLGLWQAHYNLGNFHKLHGNLHDAIVPFQNAMRLRRLPGQSRPELKSLFAATSRTKLTHDIEQMTYLIDRGMLPDHFHDQVAAYRHALAELEPEFQRAGAISLPPQFASVVGASYNRLLHFHDAAAIDGPAVNPQLDTRRIESEYFRRAPGIAYFDDFLTPAALEGLRRFCMESTVWFDFRYAGGYVGGSLEEGFACPLLAQVAAELPIRLPAIFGDHKLTRLWGYKYDSERSGISEHADFAAVNVNFWLTPDEANLDRESGGLVVWDQEAPLDWDFDSYNQDTGRIQLFLEISGARAFTVPHKQNRVVIFNSNLFHKTDSYRFRTGYANRRLNVTFLYGYRQASDDPLRGKQ